MRDLSKQMTDIKILNRHKDFIIIDKPVDTSFHTEAGVSGLFNQLKDQVNCPLWPVHRLDKITSGLLITAKSKQASAKFSRLFQENAIHKTYLALSDKKPKKKQGTIKGDMVKVRSGNWKLCRTSNNPAITQFKSFSVAPNLRLFRITPHTGKTHQIRVAMRSVGSPIIGDLRYGGTLSDRGYLHAYKLSFNWDNEPINIIQPPTTGELFQLEEVKSQLESSEL